MIIVLLHRSAPANQWCVLRQAHPGGRITTLCAFSFEYTLINVKTVDLADHDSRLPSNTCSECKAELAARTPGAAQVVEPGRVTTVDLRNTRKDH